MHVATFFYESVWDLGVFLTLWAVRKRVKRRGDLFLWYMVLYACGRFLVEQLREDSLYLFGIRASQYLSICLCGIVAVVFLVRLSRQFRGITLAAAFISAVLAFTRILAPDRLWSVLLILSLYVTCIVLLWVDKRSPRLAKLWILADALVYLTLLFLHLNFLWHSPYFIYAGLSISPYLAICYSSPACGNKRL